MDELPLRVLRTTLHGPLILHCLCGENRPGAGDPALYRMIAHSAGCQLGRDRAHADTFANLAGEQAVRFAHVARRHLRPKLALVCSTCGAEAASWRIGSHTQSLRLKQHWRRPEAEADLTLEGVSGLLRHCNSHA